jgi:hypothetical protein
MKRAGVSTPVIKIFTLEAQRRQEKGREGLR